MMMVNEIFNLNLCSWGKGKYNDLLQLKKIFSLLAPQFCEEEPPKYALLLNGNMYGNLSLILKKGKCLLLL